MEKSTPPHLPGGMLLLDKPAGLTSFTALNSVKKALGTGKVGHTGTLDRFATGLLVVLAGRPALKHAQEFTGLDKRYACLVVFGEETDTLDPEGEVIAQAPPPTQAALEAALPAFRGEIQQTPPAYSALHVDGQRAYQIARSGKTVNLSPRPVTIYSLDLLRCDLDGEGRVEKAAFNVHCSSGAYIRSLARDIALAVSSRGRLADLRRLTVGPFHVKDALSLTPRPEDETIKAALRPLDTRVQDCI